MLSGNVDMIKKNNVQNKQNKDTTLKGYQVDENVFASLTFSEGGCKTENTAHATTCCDVGNDGDWGKDEVIVYTCVSGYEHTSGHLRRRCDYSWWTYSWIGDRPVCSGMVLLLVLFIKLEFIISL